MDMVIPWENKLVHSNYGGDTMIGIYKITNVLNNKVYIGQSNNIERRFREHKTVGEKSKIPVDLAIKKYGSKNFNFEIILNRSP